MAALKSADLPFLGKIGDDCDCGFQCDFKRYFLIVFMLQIGFFKKGTELVSKKMDSFLNSVSNMTQK